MKLVTTLQISRQNRKRVTTETGFTSMPDGIEVAQVTIYVDERMLAEAIGWKAVRSKNKRSRLQAGAVIVECDWSEVRRDAVKVA